MANELDEMTGPVNNEGRDINVIEKQLKVEVGIGSKIFEIAIWIVGFVPLVFAFMSDASDIVKIACGILGFAPGLILLLMKMNARTYFRQLQQKIQADASQIDNYLEQRVMILQNVVGLLEKSIDLDKDVMKSVAAFRSGAVADGDMNVKSTQIDQAFGRLFPQVEAYPDLKAHAEIQSAMQQNSYLQKEITAARTLYNDTVSMWNMDIFHWPVKMIVAASMGLSTRIPFTASAEIKAQARGKFF